MCRVSAPCCPHPKCGERMIRAYTRQGNGFRPSHWICPICYNIKVDINL